MNDHRILLVVFLVFGLIGAIRDNGPVSFGDMFFYRVNISDPGGCIGDISFTNRITIFGSFFKLFHKTDVKDDSGFFYSVIMLIVLFVFVFSGVLLKNKIFGAVPISIMAGVVATFLLLVFF